MSIRANSDTAVTVERPSHKGIILLAVSAIFMTLSIVTVVLRFVARRRKRQPFAANDYCALVALILIVGLFITNVLAVYSGIGYDASLLNEAQRTRVNLYGLVSITIWFAAVFTVKLSILLLYTQIFSPHETSKYIAWVVITLSGFLCCLGVPLSVFLCYRDYESWNMFLGGTCFGSAPKGQLAFGLLNIVLDLVVLALPLPSIWKLQMDINKKLGLTILFSFGLLTCTASILRVVFLRSDIDLNELKPWFILCNFIEPSLGIVCSMAFYSVRDNWDKTLSSLRSTIAVPEEARIPVFDGTRDITLLGPGVEPRRSKKQQPKSFCSTARSKPEGYLSDEENATSPSDFTETQPLGFV